MKSLLLKDIYAIFNGFKLNLLAILFLSILAGLQIGGISMHGLSLYFSLNLTLSAFAADRISNFKKYSIILPYTNFNLIFSKYLFGFFSLLIPTIICIASFLLFNSDVKGDDPLFFITLIFVNLFIFIIQFSISTPTIVSLGTQKGETVNITFGVLFLVLMVFFNETINLIFEILHNNIFILMIVSLVITIISFTLSLYLFTKNKYTYIID